MPEIKLTLPPGAFNEVVEAFCEFHGYQETLGDPPAPNTETRAHFARRMLIEHIQHRVREHRRAQVLRAAAITSGPDIT